jgi:meiosis-specific protein
VATIIILFFSVQGFISEQSITIDDLGFPETRSHKGNKSKGKGKNRKNVQQTKYRFNRVALTSAEYSNYFNPDPEVEGRILGLPELVRGCIVSLISLTVHVQKARIKSLRQPPVSGVSIFQLPQKCTEHIQLETQTQDESQILAALSLSDIDPKRSHISPEVDDTRRPKKRVKVSVAYAVDLAE